MPTYFVVSSSIDDPELLNEYVQAAGALPSVVPLKLLALDTTSKTVEGAPPGPRTVILQFDNEADFQTWYDAPAYQAIIGKRHAATTGFSVLVNGL